MRIAFRVTNFFLWGVFMILVTGASGNLGKQVLDALIRDRQPVKALYRSASDAANVPSGVEAVLADFADSGAMHRALRGIDKLFLTCAPVPQLIELETNAIRACQAAGVRHVVLNSAMGADTFHSSFPSWHAQVESVLQQSKIPYTIIRPNSFMQNLVTYYAAGIRGEGAFYSSMGNSRVSLIDARDIGDFMARVLAGSEHLGKIYDLNGPKALTYAEVAERISRVAGRPVRYVDIPPAQQRVALLKVGMPEWQVDALLDLQRYYTEGGGGETDDLFQRVVGRKPRDLSAFLAEYGGEFQQQAQSA